jgi:hypothetical protein
VTGVCLNKDARNIFGTHVLNKIRFQTICLFFFFLTYLLGLGPIIVLCNKTKQKTLKGLPAAPQAPLPSGGNVGLHSLHLCRQASTVGKETGPGEANNSYHAPVIPARNPR